MPLAQHLFRHAFRAMGSPCEVQLFVPGPAFGRSVAEAVVADVDRLERRYSRYRQDSLLSSINAAAAEGRSVTVDEETAGLLNYAAACFGESGGLFDITSGILRRAWNFAGGRLPDPGSIDALLCKVGWDKVRWVPPDLEFPIAGMEIDLGGVVKEYAADRAASICRQLEVRAGMVNLGGDIAAFGPRPDGQPWRIGIQDPRRGNELVHTLCLHNGAVASSGDYERCVVIEGTRYGHILNPRTGWPVRRMAAVSVVADLCVVAGSAATIAMLKDEDGPAWLDRLGLPHLWVDVDGRRGGAIDRVSW